MSPLKAGLNCRCPECGKGPVFSSFLGIADSCSACGADFTRADSGDGPAFFVMFIIGILVTPGVLLLQVVFEPPVWLQIFVWTPVIIGLALWMLRPFKSIMFALQWNNRAEEAQWEDNNGGGKGAGG